MFAEKQQTALSGPAMKAVLACLSPLRWSYSAAVAPQQAFIDGCAPDISLKITPGVYLPERDQSADALFHTYPFSESDAAVRSWAAVD